MAPSKNSAPAVSDPTIELFELELREAKEKIDEMKDQLILLSDGQAILSQEIAAAKSGSVVTIPQEMMAKIDPALVFSTALNAALENLLRNCSIRSFRDHAISNSDMALDVAMAVLERYIARHAKP